MDFRDSEIDKLLSAATSTHLLAPRATDYLLNGRDGSSPLAALNPASRPTGASAPSRPAASAPVPVPGRNRGVHRGVGRTGSLPQDEGGEYDLRAQIKRLALETRPIIGNGGSLPAHLSSPVVGSPKMIPGSWGVPDQQHQQQQQQQGNQIRFAGSPLLSSSPEFADFAGVDWQHSPPTQMSPDM
eukprot:CAMPEP_0173427770 /NCGR_PEP_ID=MMETSP1357-20121228/6885_1 /TAXON_ID=77926 /ORGANISM="Hemiselmis rufescens, Strain PCC563" /LENGTH=184 /DNA_ID=CAMNT_0014391669 /DNA_START=273 /DNA_END=824 /DNA_ORIENTATION=-